MPKKIANSDTTVVVVNDEPDHEIGGGACHDYEITDKDGNSLAKLPIQHGAVGEHGVNGIRDVDMMHIIRHRLIDFQKGEHACEENEKMLYHICAALNWEAKRTQNRQKRNVEGTSKK